MDLDALAIRLGKAEQALASLDPAIAEKLSALLQGAQPILDEAKVLVEKVEVLATQVEEVSAKLVSYAGDLNERVAALELVHNNQTTAPQEAPPEVQPAPAGDALEQPAA